MPQLYQQASQQGIWTIVGPPSTCAVQLAQALVLTYADGSTDSLPAHVPATTARGQTQVDRTAAVWVAYTEKGTGTLRLIEESNLAALASTYAPLARVLCDRVVPYQPQAYLGAAASSTTTPLVSSSSARVLNLWNGTSNNSPPAGWEQPAFSDSGWATAYDQGYDGLVTGAHSIWTGAGTSASTQQALVRQAFVLSAHALSVATLRCTFDLEAVSSGIWINGTVLSGGNVGSGAEGTLVTLSVPPSVLVAGASNVIALWAQGGVIGFGHVGYALDVVQQTASGVADPGTQVEGDVLVYQGGAWSALHAPVAPAVRLYLAHSAL